MDFQNYMYAPSFIESDAAQFLITAALMQTSCPSRSSSTIPQLDAMGMCIVFYLFSRLLVFALDTDDQGPDEGGTYKSYLGVPFLLKSHLDARQEAEEDSDDPNDLESDTLWQDGITSFVHTGQFSVTQKLKVQRIEYLPELTSVWPIPRVPTAFVIDLPDERYDITDNDGDLLPVDCIIIPFS
ncbi:hypothetical protein B0H13DRAFT_2669858 [Mycena leptocephala]|nr:hypothetical protein B0H13DRAFT_2669858 [Mycena leptocephala]